jgi:hypothetical protein
MSRKWLQADDPLRMGKATIIPVAEVRSFSMVRGEVATFAARKRPKAVVVLGPWGAVALNVEGEEVSLQELADEVSGLKELMAGMPGSAGSSLEAREEKG